MSWSVVEKKPWKPKYAGLSLQRELHFPQRDLAFFSFFKITIFLFQIYCISYMLYFFKQRTFYFWSRLFIEYLHHSTIPCLTAFQLGNQGECVIFLKCQRVELPLIMCKMCRNVHSVTVSCQCIIVLILLLYQTVLWVTFPFICQRHWC